MRTAIRACIAEAILQEVAAGVALQDLSFATAAETAEVIQAVLGMLLFPEHSSRAGVVQAVQELVGEALQSVEAAEEIPEARLFHLPAVVAETILKHTDTEQARL
jgi:hypothetical protein